MRWLGLAFAMEFAVGRYWVSIAAPRQVWLFTSSHFVALFGLVFFSLGHFTSWAYSIKNSRILDDLQTTPFPAVDASWGLMYHYLTPYIGLSWGMSVGGLIFAILGGLEYVWLDGSAEVLKGGLWLFPLAACLLWASIGGVILRNVYDLYIYYVRKVWEHIDGYGRFPILVLAIFTFPFLVIFAVLVLSSVLLTSALALAACMIFGDGAHEYLTPLSSHPYFENEDSF